MQQYLSNFYCRYYRGIALENVMDLQDILHISTLALMVFEIYLCFTFSMCEFAKGNSP